MINLTSMQSVIDYKDVWSQIKSSAAMTDLCTFALGLIFLCLILRIVTDLYIKKEVIDAKKIISYLMSAGLLAALIGNSVIYTVLSETIVSLYSAVDQITIDFVDKARDQIKYLLLLISQHESDQVSFFNPVLMLTNPIAMMFSSLVNISLIAIIMALVVPTVYLFFVILAAPVVLPFSMLFGAKIFEKWLMTVFACVMCQISIGIAFLIIGDLQLFTLIGDLSISGSLQLALIIIILSIVLCVFIPLFHGYLFDSKIFYVFPLLFSIVTFFFGGFVITIKLMAMLRSMKVAKNR